MLITQIHVGTSGTVFEAQILEDDESIVNISLASFLAFMFIAPDQTFFTRPAFLSTDGTDGKMRYVCVSGDFLQSGQWQAQPYLALPGWTGHGNVISFPVYPNIANLFSEVVTTYSGFCVYDSDNNLWQATVLPSGNLFTALVPQIPNFSFPVIPPIFQDSVGNFWQITITLDGGLDTVPILNPATFITNIPVYDENDTTWTVTVLPSGDFDTN